MKLNDVGKFGIFSLALLPLLSLWMVSIAIFLFVIGAFLNINRKDIILNFQSNETKIDLLIHSLPLILFIISLIWTDNLDDGISFVNRSWALIIIPASLFVLKPFKQRKDISSFIKTYIISCTIFSIIFLGYMIYKIYSGKISYNISKYINVMEMRQQIDEMPFINEHPIYINLLLGSALIFLFFERFKRSIVNYVLGLLILASLFIASSRGPFIALILIFSGIILINFKNTKKSIIVLALFLGLVALVISQTPLKSRFKEITKIEKIYPEGDNYNSFNLRMGIYKCAFMIAKTSPYYGNSPGDVQPLLNQCYLENFDTDAYIQRTYNTHNQYLFYWLSFGPIGFILLLISYILFLNNAIVNKNFLYLFFLIFFFVCFLFENILSRNTGIVLFSLFNCIFYQNKKFESDSN